MTAQPMLFSLPESEIQRKNIPIPHDALAVLRELHFTIPDEGVGELVLPLLASELYQKIAKVLDACDILWHRYKKKHLGFPHALRLLAESIDQGAYYDSKRALEFFATSPLLAAELADELQSRIGYVDAPKILEPSAGDGALIEAVLARLSDAQITAIECDPRRAQALFERYEAEPRVRVLCMDVMEFHEDGWDGVIMNPPFAHSEAHIRHAAQLVRYGGHVVGIAMLTRSRDEALWYFLQERSALCWLTGAKAFIGTTVDASCFAFDTYRSDHDTLVEQLAAQHPSIGLPTIYRLERLSAELHTLFTAHCNGDIWGEKYDEEVETRCSEIARLVRHEGIEYELLPDPRAGVGFVLKLPCGFSNDFGGRGLIVPRREPQQNT